MGKEEWAGHCSLACLVNMRDQDALPLISLMREPVSRAVSWPPSVGRCQVGP